MQVAVDTSAIGLGAVFTLMIVTLGPIKILGPFAQATASSDPATTRTIAIRAFFFSVAAILISAVAGLTLLEKWHISVPGLELAGGLIFLIIGLRIVLEQYQPAPPPHAALDGTPTAAALRLTFPTIITPYGIAAVMVLLARSHDSTRTASIVVILLAVMVLNLLSMLSARKIMNGIMLMILRLVGSVLGVLQVALAVEMILRSLTDLRVITG